MTATLRWPYCSNAALDCDLGAVSVCFSSKPQALSFGTGQRALRAVNPSLLCSRASAPPIRSQGCFCRMASCALHTHTCLDILCIYVTSVSVQPLIVAYHKDFHGLIRHNQRSAVKITFSEPGGASSVSTRLSTTMIQAHAW